MPCKAKKIKPREWPRGIWSGTIRWGRLELQDGLPRPSCVVGKLLFCGCGGRQLKGEILDCLGCADQLVVVLLDIFRWATLSCDSLGKLQRGHHLNGVP